MSVLEEAPSQKNGERIHQHLLDACRQQFQCTNQVILAFARKTRTPSGMSLISPERQGIAAPVSWAQSRPADSGIFLLAPTARILAMRTLLLALLRCQGPSTGYKHRPQPDAVCPDIVRKLTRFRVSHEAKIQANFFDLQKYKLKQKHDE